MQLFSKVTIVVGVVFILYGCTLVWQRNSSKRLSFGNYTPKVNYTPRIFPQSIEIPNASINVPIIPSELEKNSWQTTSKGVSYLTSSPLPGTYGNSILYGHNWSSILGNLNKVKTGEKIYIVDKSGNKKEFIIRSIAVVTPDQIHVLDSSNDVRITLYTCTGFLDSKRLVVTAVSPENEAKTQLTERRNDL